MKMLERIQKTACLFIGLTALSTVHGNDKPWHCAMENFNPPKPGEYPRLLFHRTALPALKEKAMAGTPDRDGRYGFRKPGGPSVSWYAVGYDLLL